MATSVRTSQFARALRIQARVVNALLLREVITRYGRDNLGFIWLFLEPMIFTLSITALWSAIEVTHGSTLPIVAFALTGYSSILLWRNAASRCLQSLQSNIGLMFHRPVRALDVLLAKSFLEIFGASLSFFGLSVLWISIGWSEPPTDIAKVLGGWVLLAWMATALAVIIGALTAFSEIIERLWHPTAYILFPLSGAGFMVEWLNPGFREFILWLPIVHCVELIRDGYFGAHTRTHYDIGYILISCLIMTAAGLALTRIASRRLEFE